MKQFTTTQVHLVKKGLIDQAKATGLSDDDIRRIKYTVFLDDDKPKSNGCFYATVLIIAFIVAWVILLKN